MLLSLERAVRPGKAPKVLSIPLFLLVSVPSDFQKGRIKKTAACPRMPFRARRKPIARSIPLPRTVRMRLESVALQLH